jgi:hypothetical protein
LARAARTTLLTGSPRDLAACLSALWSAGGTRRYNPTVGSCSSKEQPSPIYIGTGPRAAPTTRAAITLAKRPSVSLALLSRSALRVAESAIPSPQGPFSRPVCRAPEERLRSGGFVGLRLARRQRLPRAGCHQPGARKDGALFRRGQAATGSGRPSWSFSGAITIRVGPHSNRRR